MKRRIIIAICISLLGVAIGVIGVFKYYRYNEFNFIFKYGVEGANCLNTFDGTSSKIINNKIEKKDMNLTQQEMKYILDKMQLMDIFNYPSTFARGVSITTNESVYLEIKYRGKVKVIEWTSQNYPLASIDVENNTITYLEPEKDKEVIEFLKLKEYIIGIIEQKDKS